MDVSSLRAPRKPGGFRGWSSPRADHPVSGDAALQRTGRQPHSVVSANHVLFLLAMMVVIAPLAFALDPLAAAMRGHWPELLRRIALETTGFAKAQWVLVPTGIVLLATWAMYRLGSPWRRGLPSRPVRICAYMFVTTGSAELLSGFLKGVFGRPRPFLIDTEGVFVLNPMSVDEPFLSFPPGHSTAIAASCMAAALLWPPLRRLMLPLALWLGFTRIVTGAHHPSDVLVGLVLGAYLALLLSIAFERNGWLSFPDSQNPAR
jgi:membrane-associated phospholipid phosphatase